MLGCALQDEQAEVAVVKLHWSPRSPFVRKVMVAAHELGLADRITCVRSLAAMASPNPAIMTDNPLSKIPALVLDTGEVLIDSSTIVEYLNDLAGGSLLPAHGAQRWHALSQQALASGLLDLLVLWRNERDKPQPQQTPAWLAAFAAKAQATLDRFEAHSAELAREPFSVEHIAIGCALSYVEFRFANLHWAGSRPGLAAWHATFEARPSAKATKFADG